MHRKSIYAFGIDFSDLLHMVAQWRLSRLLKFVKKSRPGKIQDESFSSEIKTCHDAVEPETPVPEVSSRLSGLIEGLNASHKNAESAFLQLGQNIQAISSNAAELMQGTIKTVNLVGGASGQGITAKADKLVQESLEQVKASLDDAVKHHGLFTTYMQGIGTHFTQNYQLCGELKSTARYLKMVGTNMQIECSRSTQAMEMFSIVAQEIRELSNQFLEVSKKIRNVSKQAQNNQDVEQTLISEELNKFFKLVEDAQKTAQKAIEEVEAIMHISIEAIARAEEHSKKISAQVTEIVMLIQFHDNMRQRIEHVAEAAHDVEELCAKDEAPEETPNAVSENLSASHVILNIQTAQIQKIIDDINAVYVKGEQAFKEISNDADGFLRSLSGLEASLLNNGGGIGPVSNRGPFETMESEMARLSQITGMGASLLQNMHQAFSTVIETAAGLSSYTDEVHEIASRTHLTAINAKVNTERLGKDGMALNKLAEEVIDVSKQSEGFVARVEELQQLILSSSRDMEAQLNIDSGVLKDDTTDRTDLSTSVGTVSETFEQFRVESSDLSRSADALQKLVSQTDRQLAFIPALAEEITHYKVQLEDLCQDLSPWGRVDGAGLDDEIDKVVQRYTMQEERDIAGQRLRGVSIDASGSNGEDAGQEIFNESPDNEDEFGDNIELF